MADDLDDDWWMSEAGGELPAVESESDGDDASPSEDTGAVGNHGDRKRKGMASVSKKSPKKKIKKQKTDKSKPEDDDRSENIATEEKSSGETKKKQKRKKISAALAKSEQKPLQYTDLLNCIQKHFGDKLSVIEADEIKLTEENFAPCSESSESAADYLGRVLPRWNRYVSAAKDAPGAPLLLVVCSGAVRAVDFIRELKKFHFGQCKVGKLFAKHMKLKEQAQFLKKTNIHIGVGTPNRISALLGEECLRLDRSVMVVFDWSWRDVKLRRLFDIKELRQDLLTLLQKHLVPKVKDSRCRFGLF